MRPLCVLEGFLGSSSVLELLSQDSASSVLSCRVSSPDPGSHPGVLSAPAPDGFFWAGGPRAQIHRAAGHRTHHQPHRPLAVHRGWKEVWDSLGNSGSVSGCWFRPPWS